jgi:hypothetical protein
MFITIVELPEYIKDSKRLLDEESQDAIKDYLSVNPKAGELIKGTGGSEEATVGSAGFRKKWWSASYLLLLQRVYSVIYVKRIQQE